MRTPEEKIKQVPSALQKFRPKISIAAYGGVSGVKLGYVQAVKNVINLVEENNNKESSEK